MACWFNLQLLSIRVEQTDYVFVLEDENCSTKLSCKLQHYQILLHPLLDSPRFYHQDDSTKASCAVSGTDESLVNHYAVAKELTESKAFAPFNLFTDRARNKIEKLKILSTVYLFC